jgi:hypothetical protein
VSSAYNVHRRNDKFVERLSQKTLMGDTARHFGVSRRVIWKCVLEEFSNWGRKYLHSDHSRRSQLARFCKQLNSCQGVIEYKEMCI